MWKFLLLDLLVGSPRAEGSNGARAGRYHRCGNGLTGIDRPRESLGAHTMDSRSRPFLADFHEMALRKACRNR
jgi:hypothetical protein